jgi:hypothetical protein
MSQRATTRAATVQLPCNPCSYRGGHPPYTPRRPARLYACTLSREAFGGSPRRSANGC